jgi:hypothetical protein
VGISKTVTGYLGETCLLQSEEFLSIQFVKFGVNVCNLLAFGRDHFKPMHTFNGIFCSWYNDVLAVFGQYDDVSVIRTTNIAFTAIVRIEELF